jgi:hypothetical protein
MNIYQGKPYTYLIGWSNKNKFYYGVRWAKDCDPNDLWVSYFTSSKHVHNFINEHGEPDIIKIRKTFTSPHLARIWESRVLKKLNVCSNEKWINRTDNLCFPESNHIVCKNIHTNKTTSLSPDEFKNSSDHVGIRKGMPSPFKNCSHSDNAKNTISLKNTGKKYPEHSKRMSGENNPMFGYKHPDEVIAKQVATLKKTLSENPHMLTELSNRSYRTGFNKCISNTIWINNGSINKRIKPGDLCKYPGFIKGRLS